MRSAIRLAPVVLLSVLLTTAAVMAFTRAVPSNSSAGQTPPTLAAPRGSAIIGMEGRVGVQDDTVVRVYQQVSPAVVNVISSVITRDIFSAQPIPQEAGTGSGFIIDEQGHIVTNNHVVQDADQLEVALPDGQVVPASLVGRDPVADLAVLKVDVSPEKLAVVTLGDSDQVQVGELAIAIGNPFGLERTVTTGVVSAVRQAIQEPGGVGVLINAIQTDASINPGNSGGPLLNGRGEVIGVNTMIFSPSGTSAGVGFAIPVNSVKRIVPELIATGRYSHPFMGVGTVSITGVLADALGLPTREGLLVQEVTPGSGAARAGLRGATRVVRVRGQQVGVGGDIITAVDGQPVKRDLELRAYLELNKRAGDQVRISLLRNSTPMEVTVTLGERPTR